MASPKQFGNLSSVKQRMQNIWQNPSAVSAAASLGVHGLLFVALPLLPYTELKATEPDIREPVEVVELTPEEQKRLPEFSSLPPMELPNIQNPPPPSDSDLFSFSTLPKPPASSLSPSPDSLFVPPPLPIFIPPAPPAPVPSFSIQIPTAPPLRPATPAPQTATPSPSPSATAESEAEETPDVAVEEGPESPQPEQAEQTEQPETEIAASPSPARSEEQIQQDLIARQQELRELYTYNASGTSVEDANTSFLDWFSQTMGREYADGDSKPNQQEVSSEYPKLACPLKQSRNAVVGVAVDADNQIASEPKILQSSGYRLFNQEALKVAESYTFENTSGEKQLYLLRVNFEYNEEVCPPGFAPLDPVG